MRRCGIAASRWPRWWRGAAANIRSISASPAPSSKPSSTADVEAAGVPLPAILRFSGLVEIEFKLDARDGRVKLLDVNPRAWTWIGLGAAAGVDFPRYPVAARDVARRCPACAAAPASPGPMSRAMSCRPRARSSPARSRRANICARCAGRRPSPRSRRMIPGRRWPTCRSSSAGSCRGASDSASPGQPPKFPRNRHRTDNLERIVKVERISSLEVPQSLQLSGISLAAIGAVQITRAIKGISVVSIFLLSHVAYSSWRRADCHFLPVPFILRPTCRTQRRRRSRSGFCRRAARPACMAAKLASTGRADAAQSAHARGAMDRLLQFRARLSRQDHPARRLHRSRQQLSARSVSPPAT